MRVKLACSGLALLAALTLGIGGAAGRGLAGTATLAVEVIGGGRVTTTSGVILCGNGGRSCFYSTTTGTLDLTAEDVGTWTFDSWSGCPSTPVDNVCSVDLSSGADYEVTASFNPSNAVGYHTLTITVPAGTDGAGGTVNGGDVDCGSGGTSCTWADASGSTFTVVETPDADFIFGGWSGDCGGTGPSCTLTMDGDHSASATFRKPKLTVTLSGNGTVTGEGIACTSGSGTGCAADEAAGKDVTLTATPPAGGSFTGWGGACTGKETTCTVTMTGDRSVTATFSGGGPPPSTFPLTVSVTGDGTVAGSGISCGAGGSDCNQTFATGTSVTLTATPGAGATFSSWGGACTGSGRTCTVTMTAARNVTATFSGGSAATVSLSVTATGPGTVTGGGISCGNGKTACSSTPTEGSTVVLTAAAATGATFAGWGGACGGAAPACTLQMDAAKQVTAAFRAAPGGRTPATGTVVLASGGRPLVKRAGGRFQVTLRYRTRTRGKASVLALRAGRAETSLAFTTAAGAGKVGPFPVAKPGFYTFELRVGTRVLRWKACLGRCGERASRRPFVLTRGRVGAVNAGALWSLTLHFRSTQPAGLVVQVYRGKRRVREVRFPIGKGSSTPGALLLSPGTYRVQLTATDGVGRVRTVSWFALLP